MVPKVLFESAYFGLMVEGLPPTMILIIVSSDKGFLDKIFRLQEKNSKSSHLQVGTRTGEAFVLEK